MTRVRIENASYLLTVDETDRVLRNATVLIENGLITEVRPESGSLRPREVSVPGRLVDYVLVAPDQRQTYHGPYDLALAGLERSEETFFVGLE